MFNIVTLAAAAMALQGAPAEEPTGTQVLENVSIPQELSPALMPYLACRQSEAGVDLYDKDGKLINPRGAQKDCDAVRVKSRGKAVGIMKDLMLGRNRTERLEVADYWLNRIDTLTTPAEIG